MGRADDERADHVEGGHEGDDFFCYVGDAVQSADDDQGADDDQDNTDQQRDKRYLRIAAAPQDDGMHVGEKGGFHVFDDFIDLSHVADAERGENGGKRKEDAQDFANRLATAIGAQSFIQIVHGAAAPFVLLVAATVVDAQHVFRKVRHHAEQRGDPHPEDGTGPADGDGGGDACDISRADGGGQRRAERLELGYGAFIGFVMGISMEQSHECLRPPMAQMGDLEEIGGDAHEDARSQ